MYENDIERAMEERDREDMRDATQAVLSIVREQNGSGSRVAPWRGCGNYGEGVHAMVLACGALSAGVSSTYRYEVMGGKDVIDDEEEEVRM